MTALHTASGSGSGGAFDSLSGTTNGSGPADDYAFFRSFVAAQAAQDPELAKLLGLQEAQPSAQQHVQLAPSWQDTPAAAHGQSAQDGQQQQQPCNGAKHSSCAGGVQAHVEISTCRVGEQQEQADASTVVQLNKVADGSSIAVHIIAAADSPTAHQAAQPAAQQHQQSSAVAAAAAVRAAAPSLAAAMLAHHGALRPDFTRNQIKSLRKLFPIQSPAVKSAAVQGEYQLLDLLGKGAFGAAYKARHLKTGQLFCIKTVEAAGAQGPGGLEQQKREVAVLAALQHPNIIRYHDCFSDGSKLQIVMEWADGGDLQGLLQQHTKAGTHLPQEQLLAYFVQLVAALAHIHGAGVMHRDLKTNNILLTSQGLLKIGDFGIAKVLDAPGAQSSSGSKAGSTLSNSGAAGAVSAANAGPMAQSFVGTPNYLAPEQLGCGPYNQKADVWAIGCVLYEMAALRPAFKADRIPLIYRLIKRGRIPPLPSFYSEQLRGLQQQLMAQDPWARPSSAELLQHELLRPHLECYKQQLQQLGLDLPPLPRAVYSSSGGSAVVCSMPSASGFSNSRMEPASYLTLKLDDGANLFHGDGTNLGQRAEIKYPDRTIQGLQPDGYKEQSNQLCETSAPSIGGTLCVASATAAETPAAQHTAQCNNAEQLPQQIHLAAIRAASHDLECAEFRQQQLKQQQQQQLKQKQQQQRCLSLSRVSTNRTLHGSISSSSALALLCKHFTGCISCGHVDSKQGEVPSGMLSSADATFTAAQDLQTAAAAADSAAPRSTTSYSPAGASTLSASTDPSSSQNGSAQEHLDHPSPLVFDEARLLPPLRRTLSTVLSSNISTVLSSNISTVLSSNLGSVVSSTLGSSVGGLPGALQGSTTCTAPDSTPCSVGGKSSNAPSSRSSRSTGELTTSAQPGNSSSSSSSNSSSIRGPAPSRWSAMLRAAGLRSLGSNGPTPPVSTAQAGDSCNRPIAAAAAAEADRLCSTQWQQQQQQLQQHQQPKQQHALQPHQLQHMHMLAERYTAQQLQQQQQLHSEPSGLSTISERSESKTTPRGGSSLVPSTGHSFTSNFTVGEHEVALSPLGHGCEHQGMFSPRTWVGAHAVQAVQVTQAVQVPHSTHAVQAIQMPHAAQAMQTALVTRAVEGSHAVQSAQQTQAGQTVQAVQALPTEKLGSTVAATATAHSPVITAVPASIPADSASLIPDVNNHQYAVAGHRLTLAAVAAAVTAAAPTQADSASAAGSSSSSSSTSEVVSINSRSRSSSTLQGVSINSRSRSNSTSEGVFSNSSNSSSTSEGVSSNSTSNSSTSQGESKSCSSASEGVFSLPGSASEVGSGVLQQHEQQQCALRDEQVALQSLLRKLRVQMCCTPTRSAAASPWGSYDSSSSY